MKEFKQDFTPRQYMVNPDFELFHYYDETAMEIEYHNHDFYEIYFFISGRVTYMIEGKSYRTRPGDIFIINNRELHKPVIEQGETYERVVVWVKPEFLVRNSASDCDLTQCFESSSQSKYNLLRPHKETLEGITRVIAKFEKACSSGSYGNSILKGIYLIELLVYLNRAWGEAAGKDLGGDMEYNEKISNVIKYINENLGSELSLDKLAARFYLSKYHLLREFKRNVGYTIHQYMQRKRLIMAKSLLKEGQQVTEVCMRCGFGDYSNFIRAFKREFGMSPRKYGKSGS
jgi:AraC-like DNA-binding protein